MAPHVRKAAFIFLFALALLGSVLGLVIYYNPPSPYRPVSLEAIIESPRDFSEVVVDAWVEPGHFGLIQVRFSSFELDLERGLVISTVNSSATSGFWGTLYSLSADANPDSTRVSSGFRMFIQSTEQPRSGLYQIKGKVVYTEQRVYALIVHSMVGPQ